MRDVAGAEADLRHQDGSTRAVYPILSESISMFTNAVGKKVRQRPVVVAVLPVVAEGGLVTEFSHHIANRLMIAFLALPNITVVDRGTLGPILDEIDLASIFDAPIVPRIITANVLIVGRYSLNTGVLTVDLKAVDVATNKLVFLQSYRTLPDEMLRQMAFKVPGTTKQQGVTVREFNGQVRVLAHYTESGADIFRLLDRVKQRIRTVLAQYLRDARGLDLTPEENEEIFGRGIERSCEFSKNSVILEMEFGVAP